MKTVRTNFLWLVYLGIFILGVAKSIAATGDTTVCKWKDNKAGGYALFFDDSIWSHRNYVVPELISRGFTGTFWINPASRNYGYGIMTWESLASRTGMDLENHSMNHAGAPDYAEAEYDLGRCSEIIWTLRPPGKSKLCLFASGGGTTYVITQEERNTLYAQFHCYGGRGDADSVISVATERGNADTATMIAFAQQAIDNQTYCLNAFHGVGPEAEYLHCPDYNFSELLDFLVTVEDQLWIGTALDVHMYKRERSTANVLKLQGDAAMVRLDLTSGEDPVDYDYPLTLITEVDSSWTNYCKVTQGTIDAKKIYPVDAWASSSTVMYEAIPGKGEVKLESCASMDTTPPGAPAAVRDGTGPGDIATTGELYKISANWDASDDTESGIARYWYKVGTTPGGSEVFDWIDNGMYTVVTTSRTNISLSRGVTYYITVKAVNGVGLESAEVSSDGQCAETVPGYVKIYDDFETGDLSKWGTPSQGGNNTLEVTGEAAYNGAYGLKCHIEDASDVLVGKNLTTDPWDSNFVSFYFKLSSDFSMPQTIQGGAQKTVTLMTLYDANSELAGSIFLANTNTYSYIDKSFSYKINLYVMYIDDTDWKCAPYWPESYTGFLPVTVGEWHWLELHTKGSNVRKGGLEIWLDGVKVTSCLERPMTGRGARRIEMGVRAASTPGVSGDIYIDNLILSDSHIEGAIAVIEDDTPPEDIAWVNDGTGADIDSVLSTAGELSANWAESSDPDSGILRYEYAIGTTAGDTDVSGWASNGTMTSVTCTGLSLTQGTVYYFTVKAVNGAYLNSNAANSNGQETEGSPAGDGIVVTHPGRYSVSAGGLLTFQVSGAQGQSELKIYTISGKLVRKLPIGAGESEVDWDVLNEAGRQISRGLYVYSIRDEAGKKKTGKLLIDK
jgi:hypothetical protein